MNINVYNFYKWAKIGKPQKNYYNVNMVMKYIFGDHLRF